MSIDIKRKKAIDELNKHFVKNGSLGFVMSDKAIQVLYKMNQELEQLQSELDKTCVNFEQYVDDKKAELEQQQALLNKIKVDLIKRAESKGDVCVDLSDGIWMELCEATMPEPPEEL